MLAQSCKRMEQVTVFNSFVNDEDVAIDRDLELVNLEFAMREDMWLTRFVFDVDEETLTIFIKQDKKLDTYEEDKFYRVIVTKKGTFIGERFFSKENLTIFTNT